MPRPLTERYNSAIVPLFDASFIPSTRLARKSLHVSTGCSLYSTMPCESDNSCFLRNGGSLPRLA